MPDVTHRQFDESPSRFFTLSFPDVAEAEWPPLNASDKVTLLIGQTGVGAEDLAIPLTITDEAGRVVRWDPEGDAVSVAGTHTFVIRVTPTDGKSYTHPETGTWNLIIDRTAPATDLPDPA